MNLTEMRAEVRHLHEQAAQAEADALGLAAQADRMQAAGTYSAGDVAVQRMLAQDAYDLADRLHREVEEGYTALMYAEQDEADACHDERDCW